MDQQNDDGQVDAISMRLMQRLDLLADCTDTPGAGLTRLYLSPAHRQAVGLVGGWMREAGLSVRMDAAATVIGELAGPMPGCPVLLLGSHLDSVRDAGRYDGNLGVLGGLAALELLHARGVVLPFGVALLAFGDEEGVRFPVTLTGSRALAGTLDIARQCAALDADGLSLGEALAAFGGDPDGLAMAQIAGPVLGFVELHIEQGPVLEQAGLSLGIVTAINGASRYRLLVDGEAGHAGTVPMAGRRDALAAAAEMLVAIRRIALGLLDVTATIGRIEVQPGAVNVIPGHAMFTLDLRAPLDADRMAARDAIETEIGAIARAHGVRLTIELTHDAAAAPCDPALQSRLERACAAEGVPTRRLPSGAGHDAMAMAALCPMAMLFVRCKGGISHNPAEAIQAVDAAPGVRVLARLLQSWGLDCSAGLSRY
ncbi:MAG: allantoate amidohydrolase [Janthinobacterium lividum]